MSDEALSLFTLYEGLALSLKPETELDHGRIETRQVSVLKASLFSEEIRNRWQGLGDGSIVRIARSRTEKQQVRGFRRRLVHNIDGSCEGEPSENIKTVREHWSVENRLHWLLDMHFSQDRMQADDPVYVANRSALNKTALAMIEHWRFWLWETKRHQSC